MKKLLSLLLLLSIFSGVQAQETRVMVRAMSKDAKFIGSSIGGAKIFVKNAETGEILAEGKTEGSTGSTQKIMMEEHSRNEQLSDENTAGFEAKLDIEKPLFVTIEAHAPINKRQARVVSSTQLWVIPGKDITGDGVVLQVPGFVIDILSPQTHERINSADEIEIKANIVMMCGCPITEGGIWDARRYDVRAVISRGDEKVEESKLNLMEKASTFSTTTSLDPGNYEVMVYSYDPVTGNTGLDRTNFIVE